MTFATGRVPHIVSQQPCIWVTCLYVHLPVIEPELQEDKDVSGPFPFPFSPSPGPLPCNPTPPSLDFGLPPALMGRQYGLRPKVYWKHHSHKRVEWKLPRSSEFCSQNQRNQEPGEFSVWLNMSFSPKEKISTRAALEGGKRQGMWRGKKAQAGH